MVSPARLALVLLAVSARPSSAGKLDLDALAAQMQGGFPHAVPLARPEAAPASKPVDLREGLPAMSDWTVMLFLNGRNNLSPAIARNLRQAAAVGSTAKIRIVAQVGQMNDPRAFLEDIDAWNGTNRYYLPNGRKLVPASLLADEDASLPGTTVGALGDMGDWRRLAEFMRWAKYRFPAHRYLLIIGNHGNGWRGLSYDDVSGRHIRAAELSKALESGGGVDVLASDACLMQMAEVVYELRGRAQVIVGSEELEPGDGYDYEQILGELSRRPGMDPERLGAVIVESYRRYYAALGDRSATTSAVRASAIGEARDAVAALVDAAAAGAVELRPAADASPRFHHGLGSIDLYDFAQRVAASDAAPSVRGAAAKVMDAVGKRLVIDSTGPGFAHGLAVSYGDALGAVGRKDARDEYAGLRWIQDTRWNRVLGIKSL